jgi:DNA-binding transcriptional MerR regulator
MANYTIKAVATKTGLNPATLRTWERRYSAVAPERQPNGTRAYTEGAVRRVHLLKKATDLGHAIGNVALLEDGALEALVAERSGDKSGAAEMCVEQLLNSIDAMDLGAFERLVGTAALAFSARMLVEDVLRPTLEAVGQRWRDGRLGIASEHAISASLSGVLLALLRTYPQAAPARPIVVASLPGERHELALQMLRLVLTAAKAPIHYLGADLPADEIARAARELASPAIALTAIHSDGLVQRRVDLDALLQRIDATTEIWIGGAHNEALAEGIQDPRVRCFRSMEALERRLWAVGN